MSVRITAWVWEHSQVTDSTTLNVLLSLADQANNEGTCWPRIKTLARHCRCDERTVYRHLAMLEELGEVSRHSRPGQSSIFQIHTATPDTGVRTDNVSGTTPASGTPDTGVREGMTLLSDRTVSEPSKNRRKAEHPLPEDWAPNDKHRAMAEESGVEIAVEVAKFRSHAEMHDRRAVRWDSAFNYWLINAAKFAAENGRRTTREPASFSPWSQ